MGNLQERTIAYLEARRAAEMERLIRKHGGIPFAVPCHKEVADPRSPWAQHAVEAMCDPATQLVVFLTGIGAATILEAANCCGRLDELLTSLRTKQVVVRGPKPRAVLKRSMVRIDLEAPPPHTSQEVLETLKDRSLRGVSVVVQGYGSPANCGQETEDAPLTSLVQGLRDMGAQVTIVFPYRWESPDEAPLLRFIDGLANGDIHAVAATNAQQVHNLFTVAANYGLDETLRVYLGTVVVGAQGPVCRRAWESHGVTVHAEAPHGHMGALVQAIACQLSDMGSSGAKEARRV